MLSARGLEIKDLFIFSPLGNRQITETIRLQIIKRESKQINSRVAKIKPLSQVTDLNPEIKARIGETTFCSLCK